MCSPSLHDIFQTWHSESDYPVFSDLSWTASMQTCLLFYSPLHIPPLTFGFGCGFLWAIMKSKNISAWQTFTWKFLTLKNSRCHRQLLSDNAGVEMRPENYPVSPHLDTPFPFLSSCPTKPQAPSATAQSQFPQRLCPFYCSGYFWRCPSSVLYFYGASIKPILTNSTCQKRQSTKFKPRSQGP